MRIISIIWYYCGRRWLSSSDQLWPAPQTDHCKFLDYNDEVSNVVTSVMIVSPPEAAFDRLPDP